MVTNDHGVERDKPTAVSVTGTSTTTPLTLDAPGLDIKIGLDGIDGPSPGAEVLNGT